MKRILPVLIVIIAIIAVGGGIAWQMIGKKYMPTSATMDYAEELGIPDGAYSITMNDELLEDEYAYESDGKVYLSLDLVRDNINSRFYWDQSLGAILYATPEEIHIFTPDQNGYDIKSWDGESTGDTDYPAVRMINDSVYIAAEFVHDNTQMEYREYEDPSRVVIRTKWGEVRQVLIGKTTPLRYKGGVKSEILRDAQEGEKMILLDSFDDWTNVSTEDGYIGWVNSSDVQGGKTVELEAPEYEAPVYSNIKLDYKINLTWHQVMSEAANASVADVIASSPGINTISPTWLYFADEAGTVSCTATQDYVDTCHAAGIGVWALFANEFLESDGVRYFNSEKTEKLLSSMEDRDKIIRAAVDYVSQFGIDGINLDFESISQECADDYIEFVRELSIACRKNKIILSINNYVPKYTSYYNRREQGIVADYVIIMGYDETIAGSDTPGPVASQSFVKEGITDTLAMVQKEKVINAIPFYTRVWSTDESGGVSSFSCGMTEAAGYLESHGVATRYLEDVGLNYGDYTSDVDGNHYEIWLQDEDAVTDEMKLIQEYDLAGVASWKAGFESGPEIWSIIAAYLGIE